MRPLFRRMQRDRDGQVRDDLVVIPGLGLRPAERALATTISATLLAMVGAVLLVACANLAALLLARGVARQPELGVRLALGASRARVVRQLVIETMLIAAAGLAIAFVLTRWTARFVEWLMPYPIAASRARRSRSCVRARDGYRDERAVRTAAGRSERARRSPVAAACCRSRNDQPSQGRARGVARWADGPLVCAVGNHRSAPAHAPASEQPRSGFPNRDVLVGDVDLRGSAGGTGLSERMDVARLAVIAARASQVPGVLGVALASDVPATGTMSNRTLWRADEDFSNPTMPAVNMLVVDTGYFHVMGVPILRGRQFDALADPAGAATAIVINETLARRLWPDGDAIGSRSRSDPSRAGATFPSSASLATHAIGRCVQRRRHRRTCSCRKTRQATRCSMCVSQREQLPPRW